MKTSLICSKSIKKKRKKVQQTDQGRKSGTILFFCMLPVKYFEAAVKQSCCPVGRFTGDTSPVQQCRKRRFSCPRPTGSKGQETTATPWTSSAAPEGRSCTHQPSHDTLCPLPPNMFCTKRMTEPPREGFTTNK